MAAALPSLSVTPVIPSAVPLTAEAQAERARKLGRFGNVPVDLVTNLAKYLDDAASTAFIRTSRTIQKQLLTLPNAIGNHVRNNLLRFVKGRVSVSTPHVSGRHLRLSELALLQTAQKLDLNFSGITLPVARVQKLVRALPQITGMQLDNCKANDATVEALKPLKASLLSLSLLEEVLSASGNTPYFTNKGVLELQAFTALKTLAIGGYGIRHKQLESLKALTQLESLTLFDPTVGRYSVAISKDILALFAQTMPNLHTLRVTNWDISTAALEALASFKKLQVLELPTRVFSDTSVPHIAAIPTLKTLILEDTPSARARGEQILKLRTALAANSSAECAALTVVFVAPPQVQARPAAAGASSASRAAPVVVESDSDIEHPNNSDDDSQAASGLSESDSDDEGAAPAPAAAAAGGVVANIQAAARRMMRGFFI